MDNENESPKGRKKRPQGATNRQNGHNVERHYARVFRELDPRFEKCKTSRQASALLDMSGIDLAFTDPFNIQLKAGRQKGLNVSTELLKMKEGVEKNFPPHYPEQNNMKIVIHKKNILPGHKATEFDEIVSMTFKDFTTLLKKINYD